MLSVRLGFGYGNWVNDPAHLLDLMKKYPDVGLAVTATGALVTDPHDRVLLVKPHTNPDWTFVGGMVDGAEVPHDAVAREIREETGLGLPVGELVLYDWAPPEGARPLPIHYFLYDCGVIATDTAIWLQESELAEFAFLAPDEAARRLAPNVAHRFPVALTAREAGRAAYLAGHGDLR